MKTMVKSFGAIFAGFIAVGVLSVATDAVLEAIGIFPNFEEVSKTGFNTPWMVWFAFSYRSIYTVLGGYLTAKLAPDRPMWHAIILGLLGTLAATGGAIATIPLNLGPMWYPIALAVTALPLIVVGAKLATKKSKAQ